MEKQKDKDIDTIIIHCSDMEWGSSSAYRLLHQSFGWEDVGYHYIIQNCFPSENDYLQKRPNFNIDKGRSNSYCGAHVKNHNKNSIGICLVGKRVFSNMQFQSLILLIQKLKEKYPIKHITGHYEYDTAQEQGKTCPNIDMDYLRALIENTKK